jgi:hypothetical protein
LIQGEHGHFNSLSEKPDELVDTQRNLPAKKNLTPFCPDVIIDAVFKIVRPSKLYLIFSGFCFLNVPGFDLQPVILNID